MLKAECKASLGFIVPALTLILGTLIATAIRDTPSKPDASPIAMLLGMVFLIALALLLIGLAYYARAKGRSGLWGATGLFGLPGLIILAGLEDKAKPPGHVPARGSIAARHSIILGVLSGWPFLGVLLAPFGLVCGLLGLWRAGSRDVRTAAVAGIVLSIAFAAGSGFFGFLTFERVLMKRRAAAAAWAERESINTSR